MLRIGITGGIGSGKSTVCRVFNSLGIPTFDADAVGKSIMTTNSHLMMRIKEVFGPESYDENGQLNRAFLAAQVFNDDTALQQLNALVHPVVIAAGNSWFERQHNVPYALKEAALLFESGSYKAHDYNILVYASEEVRIQRVMARDRVGAEQVRQRIAKQMPEQEKKSLADFLIDNDGTQPLIPQVMKLHEHFIGLSKHA